MNEKLKDDEYRATISIACDALGPFFLKDPKLDADVAPLFAAIASLDADTAGEEWPFVDAGDARADLSLMQQGLVDGAPTEDTIWEYRCLFVGPDRMPCPPWGSVYTDRDRVVFGLSTLALRDWMRQQGITRLGDEKTPEDHIGLMVLLLSWIAKNKPEVLEEYLRDHVLTWTSHYLDELIEAAEDPFYEGLAQLTKSTLEGLQNDLDIEVEYPRYYR